MYYVKCYAEKDVSLTREILERKMDNQQLLHAKLRNMAMANRKVICTGNPNRPFTLASGFKTLFPDATFVHREAGWDLTDQSPEAQEKLKKLFVGHNTFINASYIGPYVQSYLLDLFNQSVKHCDVFNIGSSHEHDGLGELTYKESKLDLRNKSLQLNTYRFQTHHIVLGTIENGSLQNHLELYFDL
jgi:hypothetical protein